MYTKACQACTPEHTVFFLDWFVSHLKKARPLKMEWPHFSTGSWQVYPSICRGTVWFGWLESLPRFRNDDLTGCKAQWDLGEASVKQSITFWNFSLIDSCSHYPAEFLTYLGTRAGRAREMQRKGLGGSSAQGNRYEAHGSQLFKVFKVPGNSAALERLVRRLQYVKEKLERSSAKRNKQCSGVLFPLLPSVSLKA